MKTKILNRTLWGFLMTFVALIAIGTFISVISFFIWDTDSDQMTQRQLHNSIVTNSTAQILITLVWLLSAFWGGSQALRKVIEKKKKISLLLGTSLIVVFITWQVIVVEVTNGRFMISIVFVPLAIALGIYLSLVRSQRKEEPNQAAHTTPASAPR